MLCLRKDNFMKNVDNKSDEDNNEIMQIYDVLTNNYSLTLLSFNENAYSAKKIYKIMNRNKKLVH